MRWWRTISARMSRRPWFTRFAAAAVPLDRFVSRVTRGRVVALGMLPSLLLTTTGRRTGLPRRNPVSYLRDGDAFVVVGTNWGRPSPPGWVFNLSAIPVAIVTVRGADLAVRAEEVTDRAAYDRYLSAIVARWPGYQSYLDTAGDRSVRIFRLIPVP
ncbi:deazaflavin-dependent oxidoreductase (nitroreductase family) [Catenuloplanes nepalensis]|uniref:Deazaflavin-dependent oxidoreductase (Nitroreductase family) n=1 Tax=Catenuloplanes nepalensis TaxID=587533 RepID=A0ABT9MV29_9ACTN|nr:nitroreductase/quinone reductase family protein [Catenuloplanes nepalensis]MDP9795297.1 deazaflavin-dependent oxidoreductase (nitroreductase family) [Catenuloplanes nepalensis]